MNRLMYLGIMTLTLLAICGTAPRPVFAATNLIPNPSLENGSGGNPTSWSRGQWGSLTASFTYPTPGRTSGSAATVLVSNYGSGDAKWYFSDVSVTPGQSYTFSDWSKSTAPSIVVARYKSQSGALSYVQFGSVAGTDTWTKFEKTFVVPSGITTMTVFHILAQNGSLTVDDYSLITAGVVSNTFSEGMVTFSMDDGYRNIYEVGLPILDAAGIKSTQAIITKSFNDPEYVTSAEVIDMAARGHEIASHTRTHPDLTTLKAGKLTTELRGSRRDLQALGITPVNTLVYPYGEYNSAVIDAAKSYGYTGARSVTSGYNTPTTNPWELKDQHVTSDVSFATIKGWIDSAIQNKTWLILEIHQQNANGGEYSNDPALLQQIVDYIVANNVKTVTVGEGVKMLVQ